MSSIQSFLRQRSQTSTFFQAPTNACYYVFIPTAGNYVGNYPPGYMQTAAQNPVAIQTEPTKVLIRDMGKTIKAPIAVDGVLNVNATSGFFREVQLINPVAAVSPTGNTTFGVGIYYAGAQTQPAGNVGDAGYGTYYIPIVIDGTLATTDGTTVATLPSSYLPIGGQM
jgi:hypothetical protein